MTVVCAKLLLMGLMPALKRFRFLAEFCQLANFFNMAKKHVIWSPKFEI
jgi:hypothetical protein